MQIRKDFLSQEQKQEWESAPNFYEKERAPMSDIWWVSDGCVKDV